MCLNFHSDYISLYDGTFFGRRTGGDFVGGGGGGAVTNIRGTVDSSHVLRIKTLCKPGKSLN